MHAASGRRSGPLAHPAEHDPATRISSTCCQDHSILRPVQQRERQRAQHDAGTAPRRAHQPAAAGSRETASFLANGPKRHGEEADQRQRGHRDRSTAPSSAMSTGVVCSATLASATTSQRQLRPASIGDTIAPPEPSRATPERRVVAESSAAVHRAANEKP